MSWHIVSAAFAAPTISQFVVTAIVIWQIENTKKRSSNIFDRPKRTESFSEFIHITRDEKDYLTVIATISLYVPAC
jgi:hypothetical protein